MTTDSDPAVAPAPAPAAVRPRWRRAAWWVTTVLATALVGFALVAPNQLSHLSVPAFVRIPVEGLVAVAVMLALPARARTAVALALGALLGLLTVLKGFDMGFYEAFDRPFDPAVDWTFLPPAVDFVDQSAGRAGAVGAVVVAGLLLVSVPVLTALAALRLTRVVVGHRRVAARATVAAALAWIACAVLGLHVVAGPPVASSSAAQLAYDHLRGVRAGLHDGDAFAREVGTDAYRDTPGPGLLTGLRGHDVIVSFVESYGRVAVEDPVLGPEVRALLADGDRRLAAAGFSARSAFLTSPTAGGGSWLAHSTLLSGVWIDNQQRYTNLLRTDRFTLATAFKRAGWRTVGVEPAVTKAWPEGSFYGYDRIYDDHAVGYRGPKFSYATMPDQYTLANFQRSERGPGHAPVMAEITLVSSHAPWAPLPRMVDWDAVGDGSVFDPMPAQGLSPDVVWRSTSTVRAEYAHSVEYSLRALISYVERYGDDHLVLVFLGDHQPAPVVTGDGASRDVPVTIVARDPAVLDRISGWGWSTGLQPAAMAPVWPMSAFRDRFLAAFGS